MMRGHSLLIPFAALALSALPLAAQGGVQPNDPGDAVEQREQRPFDALMDARAELGLSDQQVSRLQAIAARLEETNRPYREQLVREWQAVREQRRQELLRMTPEERRAELQRVREQGPPPLPESLRPLAQRIRANIAGAMREAGTVLTPAQKARAREMIRARRGGGGGARPRLGRRLGRGRRRAGGA